MVQENDTAARRLGEFLERHPDARWRFTLADIAREIGVSRQMAFMLLPGWTRKLTRLREVRVRAFARTHPAARLSDPGKRVPWPAIADEIGLRVPAVKKIWSELGLPIGDTLDPVVIKQRRAGSQRRRLARVLRVETCTICNAKFDWTVQHERTRKRYGRSVTCSNSCRQRFHRVLTNKR